MKYKRRTLGEKVASAFITVLVVLLSASFLYPIVYTLSMSVSNAQALGASNIKLLPVGFTLQSYEYLLSDGRILRYYLNTVVYASTGTALSLLLTSMVAYALSIRSFSGRRFITVFLLITMFFGGGMIATYLLVIRLRLINTLWVMILPGVGAWSVMIYKSFFSQLPESVKESARIDGANHFVILFRIVLPLSKALLATMALFSIVGFWNDYFGALIYLQNQSMHPIQMLLRKLLVTLDYKDMRFLSQANRLALTSSRTVKCAAVMITIIPVLCVYPFMQKHFAKGVLVGSIKE